MKKNLTFLTGIVFVVTMLVAGACGDRKKQTGSTDEENGSTPEAFASVEVIPDSTVKIYLKDLLIHHGKNLM